MDKLAVYTSDDILSADDLYGIQDKASLGIAFKYQLTSGELGWLEFAKGCYSIADVIYNKLDNDGVLLFDNCDDFSIAMDEDCGGAGKAACLSDDTALQRILFWIYSEDLSDD